MKFDIIEIDDVEGTITIETDEETRSWLIERGLNAIVADALNEMKKQQRLLKNE